MKKLLGVLLGFCLIIPAVMAADVSDINKQAWLHHIKEMNSMRKQIIELSNKEDKNADDVTAYNDLMERFEAKQVAWDEYIAAVANDDEEGRAKVEKHFPAHRAHKFHKEDKCGHKCDKAHKCHKEEKCGKCPKHFKKVCCECCNCEGCECKNGCKCCRCEKCECKKAPKCHKFDKCEKKCMKEEKCGKCEMKCGEKNCMKAEKCGKCCKADKCEKKCDKAHKCDKHHDRRDNHRGHGHG